MAQISFPIDFNNSGFIFVAQPTDTFQENEGVRYWGFTATGVKIYGSDNAKGSSSSSPAALTGSYFTVGK